MTREIVVSINAQTSGGRKGYTLACGGLSTWYPTLGEAKTQAEKFYGVKKWNQNYPGEYEGYGSDAILVDIQGKFLANRFGKNDAANEQIYQFYYDSIGGDDLVDSYYVAIFTKSIGINDAADRFLVKLLAKASGLDDTSDAVLIKLLADSRRTNHRDSLSLRERLRARNVKPAKGGA